MHGQQNIKTVRSFAHHAPGKKMLEPHSSEMDTVGAPSLLLPTV